ncbi:hypothetical protein GGR02_000872 [Anoxybacillus voinovskiensis]|uniref:Uncharacterized protein n=1 Tax=Anoxybacteroides voinovskiense TaxID=230470 RepID=A0A840DIH0_9BACL|nr:hypothetical protein [Anoxybacillus voinovskiensis]GGJ59364.1 hypothetical protein GCM10008982_05550 [Anoxybacillus voinovskiensis]
MQEHFHFTTDQAKIQKQYAAIFFFVSARLSQIPFYLQRRNRHLVKQEDAVIIAIHLYRKAAWLLFRTGMASLCDWELVYGWTFSRTFSLPSSLSSAALCDQMDAP